MSTRRPQSMPPHALDSKHTRGRCVTAICFSWKIITCIVSHVTLVLLVVSYCVGGAYLFRHLEKPHEIEIKKDIHNMRRNLTDKIWKFSDNATVLSENDWITNVRKDLANFEKQILTAMKTDGWDGDEDITKTQWTFAGSLFYSIIVITTIGYGHISPRTDWGKVTTIFYAIVGIPLMLLCLSNIGDIMATSFRFIYWRVCCYICTRTSRNNRRRSRPRSLRNGYRYSSRSQPPPFRRSGRLSQRPAYDLDFELSPGLTHAYSDPELRTIGRGGGGGGGGDYEAEYGPSGGFHRSSGGRRNIGNHQRYQYSKSNGPGGRYAAAPNYEEDNFYNYDGDPYYGRPSQRFSNRQRNRDRMQQRHTVERERHLGHSKRYFDSIEELNYPAPHSIEHRRAASPAPPPLARRSHSVRSVRSPNPRTEEPIQDTRPTRETRESRELERFHAQTIPRGRSVPHTMQSPNPHSRAKSVDPRVISEEIDEDVVRKTPIIPNRYAIDELEHRENRRKMLRSQSMPRSAHRNLVNEEQHLEQQYPQPPPQQPPLRHQRHSSPHPPTELQMQPRQHSFRRTRSQYGNRLELPESSAPGMQRHPSRERSPRPEEYRGPPPPQRRGRSPAPPHIQSHSRRGRSPRPGYGDYYDEYQFNDRYYDDYDIEAGNYAVRESRYRERKPRREERERLPPSPRIMSPMGFPVKRQIRRRPSYDYDDDSYGDDWDGYYGEMSPKNRPVPIWLCVFLVISYILGGAALFAFWEKWSFLDSAYFCFITLTTIGFGDFVPAKGVKDESEQSIAYCSLYLLFGISLLAMSFNLVQEEFIANVKEVAKRLGILKDDEDDD